MKYEVWMGFKNYLGQVYEVTKVAEFISKARADEYVEFCKMTTDEDVIYVAKER